MKSEQRELNGGTVLRWLLVAFVLASCVRVWLGSVDVVPQAQAQIPDSGMQRQQLLDATRETNSLLRKIQSTLQDGTLNVRVASTDKTGDGDNAPPDRSQRRGDW
jgi:hypothetical protein